MALNLSGRSFAQSNTVFRQFAALEKRPGYMVGSTRCNSTDSQSATAVNEDDSHPINGPASTLPAPIEEVKREDNPSTFSYYFKTGKAYLTFYKTGIKNIYYNFKATQPLLGRVLKEGQGTYTKLVEDNLITRREFQLAMRNSHDSRRVPIFILVFIACGELTPFVVLGIPRVVPWTCRIPRQLEKQRRIGEDRRLKAYEAPPSVPGELFTDIKQLDRKQLLHVSNVLGLHSHKWPSGFFLPPTWLLRRRVRKHTEYLNLDDILLERFGGPKELAAGEELAMACSERGLDVLGKSDSELREALTRYLERRAQLGLGTEGGVIGAEQFLRGRPDKLD